MIRSRFCISASFLNFSVLPMAGKAAIFLIGIFLTGCVSTTPQRTSLIQAELVKTDTLGPSDLALALREAADLWAGTAHVWGGTSKEGIDCSALVQTVYKDLLSVDIPRTTAQQSKVGEFVPLDHMQVGDLVFYRINRRTRHVGIYVGDNEFMHASKSNGVTISPLNDEYWQHRFWMVRRIFELAEVEVAGEENTTVQNKNRSGW